MATVNDDLKDTIIDHSAMVRLYEENLQRMIDDILVRDQPKLHRAIARGGSQRDVIRNVNRQINRTIDRSFNMLSTELKSFISMEADFHTDNLDREAGEIWRTRNTPKTRLRDLVNNTPLRDSRLLGDHFRDIGQGQQVRISSAIRRGLAFGSSHEQIADDILSGNSLKITRNQARAVVRTAITEFSSRAAMQVYTENADVLRGYQYVATLDSRTTPICARNDGRVFPIGGDGPLPPLHWNCRSTTVPVTKLFDEIDPGDERVKTRAYDSLPPRKRARYNGQSPIAEDYDAWLRRQSLDVKLRHLGNNVERVNLFQEGTLKLLQFTTPQGLFISLEVLRRLSAYATQRRNEQTAVLRVVCDSPCKDFTDPTDFPITTDDIVPTKSTDFYDRKNSNDLTVAFIRRVQFETSQSGGNNALGDIEFRGRTSSSRAQARRRYYSNPEEGFVHPDTGEWINPNRVDLSLFHEVETDILNLIRNDEIITAADKDYLLQLYERIRLQNPEPASLASIDALRRAFRISKDPSSKVAQGTQDFAQLWRAQLLAKNSGSLDDIGSRIAAKRTRGRGNLQNLRDQTVQIIGDDRLTIPELVSMYPRARQRVAEYQPSREIISRLQESLQGRRQLPPILRDIDDDLLSEVVRGLVTTGGSDWTSASINMGKTIWRRRVAEIFDDTVAGTPQDYWMAGDIILDLLRDQGIIRKSLLSSRTGRTLDDEWVEHGDWASSGTTQITLKEHLVFTDADILSVKRDSRIIRLRERIGYDGDIPLVANAGDVFYRDLNGNLTDIPVRSSGLTRSHNTIDEPIAESLNANNSFEYRVDPSGFAGFLDKYISTSVAEGGQTILNAAQRTIIQRNQFSNLTVLRHQLDRARSDPDSFWSNRNIVHQGGRSQSIGVLSNNSGEFWRTVFVAPTRTAIGDSGFRQLRERLATLHDKATLNREDLRLDWFDTNADEITSLGELINKIAVSPSAEPRSFINQLNRNPLWRELAGDPNEQMQFGYLAMEVFRIRQSVGNVAWKNRLLDGPKGDRARDAIQSYESNILPELDAAESGQGIIAVLTKDEVSAGKTNVVTQGANERLRTVIAREVVQDPFVKATFPWLDEKLAAKLGKNQITTSGYGSKVREREKRIVESLREVLDTEEDFFVLSPQQERTYRGALDRAIEATTDPRAQMTLRQLRKELDYSGSHAIPTQDDLLSVRTYLDVDSEEVVNFITQQQGNLITTTQMRRLSMIYTERLNEVLPNVERYNNFMGRLFMTAVRNSPDGTIPVRAPDGSVNTFQYLSKEEIGFLRTLEDGRQVRVTANVLKQDGDTRDINKAGQAAAANFTHSIDSYIARQHALAGRGNVYDGFTSPLSQSDQLLEDTRRYYADLLDDDTIRKQLRLLRDRGLLSQTEYREFIEAFEVFEGNLQPSQILGGGRSYLVD